VGTRGASDDADAAPAEGSPHLKSAVLAAGAVYGGAGGALHFMLKVRPRCRTRGARLTGAQDAWHVRPVRVIGSPQQPLGLVHARDLAAMAAALAAKPPAKPYVVAMDAGTQTLGSVAEVPPPLCSE
jgi:nucleoside-diphosphate-sugar epimerase